ncbi:MAG TPA: permease prefix domain 1-containing protein [Terrimesophilobacter sp.]|nr:permease prefix domain 1-containing protein [Terrimesophilobacter sp.]
MSADNSNIHRLLDEAFSGVAVTPELQDLKEELRGNLSARVNELVEHGTDAGAAATIAVNELGDIRELIEQVEAGERDDRDAGPDAAGREHPDGMAAAWAGAYQVNRVRPKPLFVIRTVLLALILVAAAVLIALGTLHVLAWPSAAMVFIAAVGVALPGGVMLADSLRQETSQHYPLPARRSALYGTAAAIGLAGLALIGLYLGNLAQPGFVVAGGLLSLVASIGFIWLGTTQTNRTKPWVRQVQREHSPGDRFSQDPVAAARFGIYTVIIWILAFAAFVVLSATTGFAWSWLVFPLGFAVFMLVLARMLFPADQKPANRKDDRKDDRQDR